MIDTLASSETPATSPRRVEIALVGGPPMTMDCPQWCSFDHSLHGPHYPADIAHESAITEAKVTDVHGRVRPLLPAFINQYPFCADQGTMPFVLLEDGGDYLQFDAETFDRMICAVEAHLPALRDLQQQLALLEKEAQR